MKNVFTLMLALVLCLTVCAVFPTAALAADNSVLNIALDGQPEHLDVTMSSMDMASEVVFGPVFEKLVAFNGESQVIPELAESWEVSEDNTVYTYHLRQGVHFHNGEEMKAADVVASMNRWIDAAANASSLVGGAHFTAVDDYTVEITMEHGTLYLNEMIAGLGQQAVIMPASVIGAVGEGELVQEYIRVEGRPVHPPEGQPRLSALRHRGGLLRLGRLQDRVV